MRCSCVNALFFPPPALPVGRRVWRTFRRHDFTYDGWNLIHETVTETAGAATNVTERQYFWGPDLSGSLQGAGGVGGLLAVSVGGRFHFPCYDANGNVAKYLDESGNAVAAYTYGDFGETLERSGPMADVFPHRFSTKYLDAETELYYYGYRFYNPALKRWMSRDPIGEEGGLNLYCICKNDLLHDCDFLGMHDCNCAREQILILLEIMITTAMRMTVSNKIPYDQNRDRWRNNRVSKHYLQREYGGFICCNKNTGELISTGPSAGTWRIVRNGNEEYTDNPYVILKYGGIPTLGNIFEDERNMCKKGWTPVFFYHSHPEDDTNFSRSDLAFSEQFNRHSPLPIAVGAANHSFFSILEYLEDGTHETSITFFVR